MKLNDDNIEMVSNIIDGIVVCAGNYDLVDLCTKRLELRKISLIQSLLNLKRERFYLPVNSKL